MGRSKSGNRVKFSDELVLYNSSTYCSGDVEPKSQFVVVLDVSVLVVMTAISVLES